ncbi:SHOCT domain-containing protein [Halobaculum litoreum]|uniref:SHOCT domain-containing protein n=1 Tax=Halobaculum litoreum TaxID=3031998 RepID=A0ABD5XPZ3_9EURY|nr:SHOCT domain-containing protein [Halobaculum sp. DT92]
MSDDSPRLVTGAMLGTFLAFGVDLVVIVAALWYVGRVSATVAAGTAVGVVVVFSLWVAVRWVRLRYSGVGNADDDADGTATATEPAEEAPLDRLKRRYADGEISDEEFERRVDRLLDADSRAESATRREPEREGEREFESK